MIDSTDLEIIFYNEFNSRLLCKSQIGVIYHRSREKKWFSKNDFKSSILNLGLMPLEKNCRVNHDAASLSRFLVAIVEICYNKKAWKELNENIAALTKVSFVW